MASAAPNGRWLRKSKFSGILLILFIVGLYVLQNKTVMPFVEGVVQSDLFDAEPNSFEQKDRSRTAMTQCTDFVREELGEETAAQFPGNDYKSWELGTGRYLISSYVLQQGEAGQQTRINYACNVQFSGGDDMDHANWMLQGLEMTTP